MARIQAQSATASPEQVERVWKAWYSQKDGTSPEARARTVRARLGPAFSSAVVLVERWLEELALLDSSRLPHLQIILDRQRGVAELDRAVVGRIAVTRAAAELRLTHPGLIESRAPSLAQIEHFLARKEAYAEARHCAFKALAKALDDAPSVRSGSAVPAGRRAQGFPRAEPTVPRYLRIARLEALGLCSEDGIRDFLREELATLPHPQRLQFYEATMTRRQGRNPFLRLKVWMRDNLPLFETFDWRWSDVHSQARSLDILCPPSPESLKKWASKTDGGWRMGRGIRPCDQELLDQSVALITPPPSAHVRPEVHPRGTTGRAPRRGEPE